MNKHSLFFYIGIFYVFLAFVVNWLFYSQVALQKKDMIAQALENANDVKRFYADRYFKDKNFKPPRKPKKDDFRRPPFLNKSTKEDKKVLHKLFSIEILERNDTSAEEKGNILLRKPDISIFEYKKWIYIYDYAPNGKIGNVIRYKNKSLISKTIYTAIFVNLTILVFVILVMRKILPIRKLKKSIVRFSKGDLDVRSNIQGKDEIAEVSHEFDNAIEKIQNLQNSRNLFLRNIMHELKTPIAKGTMITELMDDEKNSDRLRIILDRFEYLLNEFSKIEQVTSNEMKLDIKEYKNIDILENALDILMINIDEINFTCDEVQLLEVDFELFSIALKNLIDNAIKYSKTKPKVILKDKKISIISKGQKIKNLDFQKVFKREFEDSKKGLGLGLYITYSIIKKHGFDLKYLYKNEENCFIIDC